MQKAIVTCSLKGAVLKEYSHNIPEALDASRTVGPANQKLIDQAKSQLVTDGLCTPKQWNDIKFTVSRAPL
jgi:hypothetical protein